MKKNLYAHGKKENKEHKESMLMDFDALKFLICSFWLQFKNRDFMTQNEC